MKFVDEQGEGASPTLSAPRAYREHRAAGRRGVPPDAPLDFAPAALQPLPVIGSFGMLGLLLAAVGLYGVVSHAVARRRQEFGIRAALGATPAAITRLALGRGLVLTTLGLALGAVAAGAATPLVAGFLVEVSPTDPVVFTVTGLVLAGAALLACLVPSRRAAKTDPLATLRAD